MSKVESAVIAAWCYAAVRTLFFPCKDMVDLAVCSLCFGGGWLVADCVWDKVREFLRSRP